MLRRFLTKAALALGVVTLACSSGDLTSPDTTTGTGNIPTTVVITPPTSSDIVVGTSVNLVVAVKNASGQDISGLAITWSSSDATIAAVSSAGVVSGVKVGSATITGTVGTKSASLAVNVIAVPVKSVAVALKGALFVGDVATASFVASDASGNALAGRPVTWSSRNTAVASVSAAGVVTAAGVGTTTIDATVGGVTGSATVTVSPVAVQTVSVTVKPTIVVAENATASAVTLDGSGNTLSGRVVTWSSNNNAVASVSQAGVVTGVSAGTAVISATSEGAVGTATVTVSVAQVPVSTISVRFLDPTPYPGRTSQSFATVLDAAGNTLTDRAVTWTSSNADIATVSALGIVTAVAPGTANIVATSGGRSGSAVITVLPPLTAVATVDVTMNPPAISTGHTATAVPVLRDGTGAITPNVNHQIQFSSSAPAIATVSSTGIVTGVSTGTATIFATSEGHFGSAVVLVNPPAIVSAVVTAPSLTLQPTITTQAVTVLRDIDNNVQTNRVVTWTSSNPGVATVSATGLITGVASGTTTITATSEGISNTITITVPPVATINVTAVNTIRQPTQTTQASATLLDAGANTLTNRTVVWSSSNPAVATVSASGFVTAVAAGTTNIQATSETIVGTVVISVPPVATVNVTAPSTVLQPTQTTQASAALLDASAAAATNRTVTWSSANPAIATVSASGLVTAVASGTTQIKATSETIVGSLTVTVPPVASVVVSAQANFLLANQTSQMTAVPKDASSNSLTNRTIVWSSATPAVATISATGLVTAHQLGTSIITATSEGIPGTFLLTVVAPVGSIGVSGPTSSLLLGQSTTVSALILDTFGATVTTIPPVWSSSDPTKLSVTQAGVVTAINGGSFANITISATAGGVTSGKTFAVTGHIAETLPSLPQTYLNTSAPAAPDVGGTVISVSTTNQLHSALQTANPGDVIELANGVTYTGNFTLKNKGATSKWITIRPANYASLPAEGTRMTPTIAASLDLPKLQTPNSTETINTDASANHYRLIGLDISVSPTTVLTYSLVAFDALGGQTSLSQVPHDLVVDRSWVHGNATVLFQRCVLLNSASSAVIDSYLSDCHHNGSDAQAIVGFNGPGPFKIVNNYLEGSGENVMFGGADPSIPNLTPSDIEIRKNHFFKPTSWKGVWAVKNLLELKNAQRVLVESNVFEHNWISGQSGMPILFKSVNQGGACAWCVTQDITFRQNLVRDVGGFLIIAGVEGNVTTPARRIQVSNNVVANIGQGIFDGDGRGLLMNNHPADVTFSHNTIMSPSSSSVVFSPFGDNSVRFSLRDNIFGGGNYGVLGDNLLGGPAFTYYAPDGSMKGNVFVYAGAASLGYTVGNTFYTSQSSIGMTNIAGLDFHLTGASPHKNAATDGTDVGANIDALNAAISGVIIP
jgi:uncharacterized protein YjdB